MRFKFNDKKTVQAAAHILKRHGGRLPYMVLIKLLYLADRAMLLKHGQTITGDRMFSMRHGPVLSQVLDFITEGPDDNPSSWFDHIGPPAGYEIALKVEAATDELSRFELRLLEEVDDRYGSMNRWDLVQLLHQSLPEWKDPGASSSKIEPEDILRAESVPEEEISRMAQDAKDLWFLDTLSA